MCIGCDKQLTIEHILLTCLDFIEMRESHSTAKSLLYVVSGYFAGEDF